MVTGVEGLPPQVAFREFIKDPNKKIAEYRDSTPRIQNDIDYFLRELDRAESPEELLDDFRAARFLASAFGLESEATTGLGRIKKILSEDPTQQDSLVNRLSDDRFREIATELRFDRDGLDRLKNDESFRESIIDRFVRNEYEVELGQQSEQLRQAVFFAREIEDNGNVFQILGDRVLRTVVTGALQLPEDIAIQGVDTQARAIESRIDIADFLENDADITDEDIETAESDNSLIESNLEVTDAALGQLEFISDVIENASTDYSSLADDTDTGGSNGADIAAQELAVPKLIRFEQLLNSAQTALEDNAVNFDTLESLIADAKAGEGTLADLKSDFSTIVDAIKTSIDNASTTVLTGGSENLLLAGADGTQSVTIDGDGNVFEISEYDLDALKTFLDNANAAFSAVTGTGDVANLSQAEARISFAQELGDETLETIQSDLTDLNALTTEDTFFATLNSDDLRLAFRSLRDNFDRITQIEGLLGEIRDLADESANLVSGADRSEYVTAFDELRTQVRDLIENTNDTGLVNFLDGTATQSYEVISGLTLDIQGGFDLVTDIADVLDAQDISTQSGAGALETEAIQLTNDTDAVSASLSDDSIYINRAFSSYDPRGRIDSEIINLRDALSLIVDQGESNGVNLLDADQDDININLDSSIFDIELGALNDFESDTQADLDNIIDLLETDLNGAQSILADLSIDVSRSERLVRSDANLLNLESVKVGAVLDAAAQLEAEEAGNPYDVNEYTLKFIERFLILNADPNATGTGTGQNALLATLLGGGSFGSVSGNTSGANVALSILGGGSGGLNILA